MAKIPLRLDHQGLAALLKAPEVAAAVNDAARQIVAQCGGEMESYTTDRAAALVKVPAHRQARDGALTRAAAAVGLEVRMRQ